MPENNNSCFGHAYGPHQQQQARTSRLRQGVMAATRPSLPVLLPSWKLYENPLVAQQDDDDDGGGGGDEENGGCGDGLPSDRENRGGCPVLRASPANCCRFPQISDTGSEEDIVALDESPSPRSHLQFQPSSISNSDSPPSATKTSKVSKASTRSPRPVTTNSPYVKTITLIRPVGGQGASRLGHFASKTGDPNQISPFLKGAAVQSNSGKGKHEPSDTKNAKSPRDILSKGGKRSDPKQMENSPVVSALNDELKRALNRVQELEIAQITARREVEGLLKRFADDRAILKMREQEKIQAAVYSITEELGKERKARRKLEIENKKLTRNLADVSKTVIKVERELENERKARKLMEDVCDELAKEIGEDRAELEELKREHAKAREEMESERRALTLTEAWREERVQMKLSEAKLELEERCNVLEKLKIELDMFLNFRKTETGNRSCEQHGEALREAVLKFHAEMSGSMAVFDGMRNYMRPSADDAICSDYVNSLSLSRDNVRGQARWDLECNVNSSRRLMIEGSREGPNQSESDSSCDSRNSGDHSHFQEYGRLWSSQKLGQRTETDNVIGARDLGSSSDGESEKERHADEDYRVDAESENSCSQCDSADVERCNGEGDSWGSDYNDVRDVVPIRASDVNSRFNYSLEPRRTIRKGDMQNGRQQNLDGNKTKARDYPLFQFTRPNPLYQDGSDIMAPYVVGSYPPCTDTSSSSGFKNCSSTEPLLYGVGNGRNGVVESSKLSRNQCVKAKLLLEDKMFPPKFQTKDVQ